MLSRPHLSHAAPTIQHGSTSDITGDYASTTNNQARNAGDLSGAPARTNANFKTWYHLEAGYLTIAVTPLTFRISEFGTLCVHGNNRFGRYPGRDLLPWFGLPCLTIRANTERPVTIQSGTNRLVDSIIRLFCKL